MYFDLTLSSSFVSFLFPFFERKNNNVLQFDDLCVCLRHTMVNKKKANGKEKDIY